MLNRSGTRQPNLFVVLFHLELIYLQLQKWFSERDAAHRAEATPPGFKLLDHIRNDRMGGGTTL